MPNNGVKISSSNHELYHMALWFTNLYVYLGLAYGALTLAAALHVSGVPLDLLLSSQDVPQLGAEGVGSRRVGSAGVGWVQTGVLSLATAGVMGLLVAFMVRKCCRWDRSKACVVTNWHDLFKYMHMGRTITAAMTAVLTWRGLSSVNDFKTPEGGVGLIPMTLLGAAFLAMATASIMHFLCFRVKAVYAEYGKMRKRA